MIKLKFFENHERVKEINFQSFREAINYIQYHDATKKVLIKLVDRFNNHVRDKKCFLDSKEAISYLESKNIELNSKWWKFKT